MKVIFSNIILGRQAKITGLATCIFQSNSLARITILFAGIGGKYNFHLSTQVFFLQHMCIIKVQCANIAEICYAIEYIGVLARIGPRKSAASCTGHGRDTILVATKLIVILIFRKVLFTNTNISI